MRQPNLRMGAVTGVAFYFTGNGAQLEVPGGADVDFKAPEEGAVADSLHLRGNGRLNLRADADSAGLPRKLPRVPGGARLVQ